MKVEVFIVAVDQNRECCVKKHFMGEDATAGAVFDSNFSYETK